MARQSSPPRGSTLVLAMILLAVLAVVGVAAVRLGSQERVNAAAKGQRDYLVACAQAARLQLWTEISRYGSGYLQSSMIPDEVTLPDGTVLRAPALPSFEGKDSLPVVEIVSVAPFVTTSQAKSLDMTNTFAASRVKLDANGYRILARCHDPKGRELLVEITSKFAI